MAHAAGSGTVDGMSVSSMSSSSQHAPPMFQSQDPILNSTVNLDDIFEDMFYMDLLLDGETPTPIEGLVPDAVESTVPVASTASVASAPTVAPKRSADQASLVPRWNSATNSDDEKAVSPEEIIEKRERNREHAKRSRLRKKFLLDSLQEQIHGLEEQLDRFKETVRAQLPDKADAIIQSACGEQGKYKAFPVPSGFGPVKTLMEPDFRLVSALTGSQQNFAISDPTLPDNPIVFCSQGFLDLTGYKRDEVLGRNCRFLQGPGTDQRAVHVIRQGIVDGVDTSVCLLNYRADGSAFWNQFFVAALRDADNNIVNYVGIQCEVSKAVVESHMKEPKVKATAKR